MNYQRLSTEELLHRSDLRITNSVNDEIIANAVAMYGYPAEKMQEGVTLLNDAKQASEKFDKEQGEVGAAFEVRNHKKDLAQATYVKLVQLGKVALKEIPVALSVLQINKAKARTYSGWLKQKRSFYNNLLSNAEWLAAYAKYGITQEAIEEGRQQVATVEAEAENIMREKGDAQNATKERDAKLEELGEWVNDYEIIACIALADKPQLLEKLGIVVKS